MIDAAIVTVMDPQKPWRVKPTLAKTREELIEGAKSKYTLSPNNIMLRDTISMDRLAVVGLPCHIHGLRKVQSHKALTQLAQRIVFLFGIFCGSNWSYQATEHMIHEYSDIPLEEIDRFEYRGGEHAQDVKLFTRDKKEITITMAERRTVFQCMEKDRCRMCCDWSAEMADLSFGDIFDPRLRGNMRKVPNWNSLIVRTEKGQRLIEGAQKAGTIETSPLEEESFYGNIGFEIKKHGAVNNLMERRRYGWPTPNYHYEFTWQPKRKRIYPIPED